MVSSDLTQEELLDLVNQSRFKYKTPQDSLLLSFEVAENLHLFSVWQHELLSASLYPRNYEFDENGQPNEKWYARMHAIEHDLECYIDRVKSDFTMKHSEKESLLYDVEERGSQQLNILCDAQTGSLKIPNLLEDMLEGLERFDKTEENQETPKASPENQEESLSRNHPMHKFITCFKVLIEPGIIRQLERHKLSYVGTQRAILIFFQEHIKRRDSSSREFFELVEIGSVTEAGLQWDSDLLKKARPNSGFIKIDSFYDYVRAVEKDLKEYVDINQIHIERARELMEAKREQYTYTISKYKK